MATEIAKAYVQIVPSMRGVKGALSSGMSSATSGIGTSAGNTVGSQFAGKLKGVIAAAGIGAAVGASIKSSLDAGGALQQSFGGLETLYEDAADSAKKYAKEAVSAGISMNDYAEQAVSFGASLKAAYGGDTTKAMEAANVAILDMADNSAKMGTSLESIQNAYQGFAKQNYTMLDNLKLGYGGTKSEMERLLADAQKLTGISYDISNLGDVYSAIHAIQEDLNLTGVAAGEAETTFTGSMGAMKAAAQNFLADLSTGGDISTDLKILVGNAKTFILNNYIPMMNNIKQGVVNLIKEGVEQLPGLVNQIPGLLQKIVNHVTKKITTGVNLVKDIAPKIMALLPSIISKIVKKVTTLIPQILNLIPEIMSDISIAIVNGGSELQYGVQENIGSITNWITENIPVLIEAVSNAFNSIVNWISDNSTYIINTTLSIVNMIIDELPAIMQTLLTSVVKSIQSILDNISDILHKNAPAILNAAIATFNGIVEAIAEIIPTVIESLDTLIISAVDFIVENVDVIVDAALSLLDGIIDAIEVFLPVLLENMPKIIDTISTKLIDSMPTILDAALQLLDGIIQAIPDIATLLIENLPKIITTMVTFFANPKNLFKIYAAGLKMLWQIVAAVPDLLTDLLVALGETIQTAYDWLVSDGADWIRDAGAKVWDGFVDGFVNHTPVGWVMDGLDKVTDKLFSWTEDRVSDLRDLLGLPSLTEGNGGASASFGIASSATTSTISSSALSAWSGGGKSSKLFGSGTSIGSVNFNLDSSGQNESQLEELANRLYQKYIK